MVNPGARTIADFVSLVLNAPIIAFFTFLALLLAGNEQDLWMDLAVAATFGTVVPLVVIFFLLRRGIIADFYASDRQARMLPFIGALTSYLLGTFTLIAVRATPIIVATMFCYFGNSLIMMLITFRWKISIHASGITGPATVLIYYLGLRWLPFLLLVVPVGWARIRLGAHTLGQVSAGAVLTIATTWLQLELILNHILV